MLYRIATVAFTYTVRQGDYLSKIAHEQGFSDWRTIYDHPDNEQFRELRPDPNVIFPGDELFIPDREPSDFELETGRRHLFRVRRVTNELHVVLRRPDGEVYADMPCELTVGAETIPVTTSGDGQLDYAPLPPDVDRIVVTFEGQSLTLLIGNLDPVETESGAQGRLRNLGYYYGEPNGVHDDDTRDAVRRFQEDNDLEGDGELTSATTDKLREVYGF